MKKEKRIIGIFLIVSIIGTFMAIVSGNYFKNKLSITVGQISPKTIVAPFQVENEMATKLKRDMAERSVQSTYKVDTQMQEKAIKNVELLFGYIDAIKKSQAAANFTGDPLVLIQEKSPIPLYDDEYRALFSASAVQRDAIKETSIQLLMTLFESGVKENNNYSVKIRESLDQSRLNSMHKKVTYEIVSSELKPNIVIDEVATQAERDKVKQQVEPVYVLQNEIIVAQGNRVTEEAYLILEKIGYLKMDETNPYWQYIGTSILIVMLIALMLIYIKEGKKKDEINDKHISLILLLYILSLASIRGFVGIPFVLVPIAVTPMLIAILIKKELAMMFQLLLVILASVVYKGDTIFILYFILTGITSILIAANMQQRKQTMKSALMIGLVHGIVYIALKLLVGSPFSTKIAMDSALAFCMGLISMILVVGSLPLWEAAFGFITPFQLLELTNPNQPILKRLLLEATGTYYHSLLVANLAEAAADAIGANPLMARVGGYYHDIGKLSSVNYFKENQVIENPHDYLEPKASANILITHVTSGVDLANQYKLPKCVKDMVLQHHGTGVMQYFYIKAVNIEGDKVEKDDFSYPGPKPQSKEAALVMLADVVEATVRSMQSKIGVEISIDDLVRKMVKQKLEEGQLDECPLYISDIDKIIDSFVKMLKGMYHERIQYPERKEQ